MHCQKWKCSPMQSLDGSIIQSLLMLDWGTGQTHCGPAGPACPISPVLDRTLEKVHPNTAHTHTPPFPNVHGAPARSAGNTTATPSKKSSVMLHLHGTPCFRLKMLPHSGTTKSGSPMKTHRVEACRGWMADVELDLGAYSWGEKWHLERWRSHLKASWHHACCTSVDGAGICSWDGRWYAGFVVFLLLACKDASLPETWPSMSYLSKYKTTILGYILIGQLTLFHYSYRLQIISNAYYSPKCQDVALTEYFGEVSVLQVRVELREASALLFGPNDERV